MTRGGPLRVGLTRHGGTEGGGSTRFLFNSIERAVSARWSPVLLPAYFYSLSWPYQRRVMADFLRACDVVITSVGWNIGDLGALYAVREELGLAHPFIYLPLGELPRGCLHLRAYRKYFVARDVLAFSSTADLGIFNALFGEFPAQRRMLPFAIDETLFSPAGAEARALVRRHLGYCDDDVLFISAGRVTPEKNVHTLLDVFARIAARCARARLLVIGKIEDTAFGEWDTGHVDLHEFLGETVRRRGLAERVNLLGPMQQRELPALLSAADVHAGCSLHHDENFGFANIEAAGCGLPVITSDWGGLRDSTLDGETGFRIDTILTPRGMRVDTGMAVEAGVRLAEDAALRQQMGRAARAHVLARYTTGTFGENLAELVESSLQDRPGEAGNVAMTALGARLDSGFWFRQEAGEVIYPHFSYDDYPLYAGLIEPYCTRRTSAGPDGQARYLLATQYLRSDGDRLEVYDPLWSLTHTGVSAEEHAVVDTLRDTTGLDIAGIETAVPDIDRFRLLAAIGRLLEIGVICQTRAHQPAAGVA